jgi:photosystem II stability/assembly factor-like uncharacterized protein
MRIFVLPTLLSAASLPFYAQSAPPVAQAPVWTMEDSGTTAGLRGIYSVDGTVAWASGTGGTVLRTTDGGAHWTQCAIPDGDKDGAKLDFRGVQAWDVKTAIVMASGPGDLSRLYKTKDGCLTWVLLLKNPDKDGFWDAISVADQDNLMILGDPVNEKFYLSSSADGGKSWSREKDGGLKSNAKEGAFAASNSSLLADWVDDYIAFGTGSPSGARIFLGCDSCKKNSQWRGSIIPSFPKGEGAGIFALSYRDSHMPVTEVFFKGGGGTYLSNWQFVAVGGDYTKPEASDGTAAWSENSGRHWTASATPPHGYRSSVQWSELLKAWITVGTNGSDISRDDGKNWQPLDDGDWNALSLPFVVGPKGRIARLNPASIPNTK